MSKAPLNNQGSSPQTAIVIGASSDIGTAMCNQWRARDWSISGTFRSRSAPVDSLEARGVKLSHCELSEPQSVNRACDQLAKWSPNWNVLVLGPGNQEPVGPFHECNFDEWENSIRVNFTSQMRFVHRLLPFRSKGPNPPTVLFFAGGGTNNAPTNYSAYIESKIALIKMTEILDAEVPDTRFLIVGPGWVKTKIHQATIDAGAKAGANLQRTLDRLASTNLIPMEQVLEGCDWLIAAPKDAVGGRNFSIEFDKWGDDSLLETLRSDPNFCKLRRAGNVEVARKSWNNK